VTKLKEALLTRFESGRITPPPLSDTVREKVKRDALTACLTVGTASLARMLTRPIPRSVRQVRRFFVLLIAPGNGLSPPPPWDSLFPGFLLIPCRSEMICRGFFVCAPTVHARGRFSARHVFWLGAAVVQLFVLVTVLRSTTTPPTIPVCPNCGGKPEAERLGPPGMRGRDDDKVAWIIRRPSGLQKRFQLGDANLMISVAAIRMELHQLQGLSRRSACAGR